MLRKHAARMVLIWTMVLLMASPVIAKANIDMVLGNRKKVEVGVDNAWPPYEYMSGEHLKGFNIDMIQAVALETGWDLEFVALLWIDVLSALDRGEVDAILGMKYTIERGEFYDFSDPYLHSPLAIFVRQERQDIQELDDLTGCCVGAYRGDVGYELVNQIPGVRLRGMETLSIALESLVTGELEAVVGNYLTGLYCLQRLGLAGDVKTVGEPLEPRSYCLAVTKGKNGAILTEFNTALATIRKNGTYDKIYHKWFGMPVPDYSSRLRRTFYIAGVSLVILFIVIGFMVGINKRLQKKIIHQASLLARRDRLQSVGEMAASLAHEIRNPLTAIKTLVELMPNKLDNPLFRNKFKKIVPREITRMDLLLTTLLDYAYPRPAVQENLNLLDLVEEVWTQLQNQASAKDIRFKNAISRHIVVTADREQVRLILSNIILNAIQALPSQGEIKLQARTENNGGRASIICEDNGPGVSEDDMARLFDPFFSRRSNGSGLGLFLSYRLAQENGGELVAESALVQGLRVILCLQLGG